MRQKFDSVSDVWVVLPACIVMVVNSCWLLGDKLESKSSKHMMLNIFVLVYV